MNRPGDRSDSMRQAWVAQRTTIAKQLLAEPANSDGSSEGQDGYRNQEDIDDQWERSWGTPIPRRPGEEIE